MQPGGPRRPAQQRPAQPSAAMAAAMTGAVDLAAVKARSEAAARAAEAPAPTPGQYVVDVTEASFQAEAIDRSFQVPVLIVLTSARAASSAQLAASFTALANEAAGSWVLARIDIDANLRIAQALQVQAVPAVFAVISGQLVPGFEGALPEPQLREFVTAVLQAARDAGMTAPQGTQPEASDVPAEPARPEDPRFDAAEAALADGDFAGARQRFQAILDAEPANASAALALRQVDLLERIERADPDAARRADADPSDVPAALTAADLAFAADDVDAALRRLLDVLVRASADNREQVRQRLVEYFDLLGPDDPRVAPARKEMARALF